MALINWKRVAFWATLWWLVYSAPTEDPFAALRAHWSEPALSDEIR